jgi:pyridinium-3,5-biscarboxylic acid mononucleotide sulfurtransferase
MKKADLPPRLRKKLERLRRHVGSLDSAVIAYSGGVDSSLLAVVAARELGPRALAVTLASESMPKRELHRAKHLAREYGFAHDVIKPSLWSLPELAANPADRCYLCKRTIFSGLRHLAKAKGLRHVLDGTNADDLKCDRPGLRAGAQQKVISPLADAGLSKSEIRVLARALGISVWDAPAAACLATRLAAGEPITAAKLRRIEKAEDYLHRQGIAHCRVRSQGALARIEVDPSQITKLATRRLKIAATFKHLGFDGVSLDLEGYLRK